MSGQLSENSEVLKKFSYDTRISSRSFCYKLCELKYVSDVDDIVSLVRNQTWFLSSWSKDPTVQSMLRMLGGEAKDDGIEPIFRNEDHKALWVSLIGNCSRSFQ